LSFNSVSLPSRRTTRNRSRSSPTSGSRRDPSAASRGGHQHNRVKCPAKPETANVYDAREMPTQSYPARTVWNVRDSDGTIWFGSTDTPGAKTTLDACKRQRKPVMLVTPSEVVLPSDLVSWLRRNPEIKRINIAGNRESKNPGIGERVERFLTVVFKRLNERAHSGGKRRRRTRRPPG
jgi:hypothetical protein